MTHRNGTTVRAQCTTCHDPHSQPQNRTYKAESFLWTGTIASVTQSTLVMSTTTTWAANKWAPTGEMAFILIPDIRYAALNYRIASNDTQSITIDTSGTPPNYIDTNYIKPGVTWGIVRGKLIKSSVNGYAVRFFQETGTNSFADGTHTGICQVCHTTTKYFTQGTTDVSTAHAGGTSQVGASCTSACHEHAVNNSNGEGAFVPPAACQDCHLNPPVSDASLLIKDKNQATITSDSPGAGSHSKHALSLNIACERCHSGGMITDAPTQANNKISIGFTSPTGSIGGNYVWTSRATFPVEGMAPTWVTLNGTQLTCAVYCHDPGNVGIRSPRWVTNVGLAPGNIGRNVGQALPDAAQCDSCHGGNRLSTITGGGLGWITTGKHAAHIGNGQLASFACGACHVGTVSSSDDRTITGAANHVNFSKDVMYDPQWNTGATSNSCSNTYCHSDGKGNSVALNLATAWYSGANLTCNGCHGAEAGNPGTGVPYYGGTGGGTLSANTHTYHTNAGITSCGICHTSTTDYAGTNVTGALHLNRSFDVTIWTTFANDGVATGHYNGSLGNKTCSNTTCHGGVSRQWGDNNPTAKDCTKCHGKVTSSATYTLRDAAPGAGGTGVALSGATANTDAKVGAHRAHLESTHSYSDQVACNLCHTVPGGWNSAGHLYGNGDTTRGTTEIVLSGLSVTNPGGGSVGTPWYSTSGSCSNVYCHSSYRFKNKWGGGSNLTPTWNQPYITGTNPTVDAGCNVCHGYPPGGGHDASTDCHACHAEVNADNVSFATPTFHVNGLVESSGCSGCHGNPPTAAVIGGSTGVANPSTGAWATVTPGAHDKHVNGLTGRGMTCEGCHAGNAMPATNQKLMMGFRFSSITYPGFIGSVASGTFTGYAPLSGTYTWWATVPGTTITTVSSYANANTCAVYCHGSSMPAGNGSITAPRWTSGASQAACGTCHGGSSFSSAASAPPSTWGHTKHAWTSGLGLACNTCHNSITTINHMNGSVDWGLATGDARFGASASYKGWSTGTTNAAAPSTSAGNCSNVWCHSNAGPVKGDGTSAVTWATINWSSVNTVSCNSCHSASTDASPSWSTTHNKHIKVYAANANFTCAACHTNTAIDNGNLKSTATSSHVNGAKDVVFNAFATGSSPWFSVGNHQCSNTYCHSNGTAAAGTHAALSWTTTITNCTSCHGGKATWTTSGATAATGAHYHHVIDNNYTCDTCHSNTAASSTYTTIGNYTMHVDQNIDISIKNTYSTIGSAYNGQPASWNSTYQKTVGTSKGSCSTTFCHGGKSPQWDSVSNNATCVECHGNAPATQAQVNAEPRLISPGWTSGSWVGRSTWETIGSITNGVSNDPKVGAHNKHLNALAVWGTTGYSSDVACTNCHTLWGSVGAVGHMNGSTNFVWSSFAQNMGNAWGTAASGVLTPSYSAGACSATYCHGAAFWPTNRGTGTTVGWTSNAYLPGSPWNTPTLATACNQCHLSPPNVQHDGTTTHVWMSMTANVCSGCHGHTGYGPTHINGALDASVVCNSCHWYDTIDPGAWTTVEPAPDANLWNSTNAWGAHVKHINHLKTGRGATIWLSAGNDTFGNANYNAVCGVCHTQNSGQHNQAGFYSRQVNFNMSTVRMFGLNPPSWNTLNRSCSGLDCHFKSIQQW